MLLAPRTILQWISGLRRHDLHHDAELVVAAKVVDNSTEPESLVVEDGAAHLLTNRMTLSAHGHVVRHSMTN
jgi:hypothetical protein